MRRVPLVLPTIIKIVCKAFFIILLFLNLSKTVFMQPAVEIQFTGVFIKRRQGDGFMAFLKELPAVATEGDTLEEAEKNLMRMLPDVWSIQTEIASEDPINGEDDVQFTTKKFPFVPAV